MLPSYVNLRDIDDRIRNLVIEMNKLPFVDTTFSCAGHLSKRHHHTRVKAVDSHYLLSYGWLTFQVDDRYVFTPEFVEKIEQGVRCYPFSIFEQHETGLRAPPNSLYSEEVSKANAEEIERYLQDFGRYSSHYFSIIASGDNLLFGRLDLARARREQFYALWKYLTEVCREFQNKAGLDIMLP